MIALVAIALIISVGAAAVATTLRIQRSSAPRPAETTAPEPALSAAANPVAGLTDGPARQPENAVEKLVVLLKGNRSARLALSGLSFVLLLGAAGVIGYPFYTNLYQDRVQNRLDRQLASPELADAYRNRTVGEGDSLTRIKIPRIGVDVVVVEGTSASALRAGAGHYPSSPLPCEVGNVAIAGHRTTYGRPFHDVDVLQPGDRVTLETPIGTCTYEIRKDPFIVSPTQTEVVANTPDEARLTLTSCHPKGSARQRIVVTAILVSADPFDA